ncbi:NAD-dependent protein lipoamidase sirtuin-4 [Cladochytrium tenue]|nr:NAD-dependent protein lipoamidase sirtuin-4 [Cladochytrium tenue]
MRSVIASRATASGRGLPRGSIALCRPTAASAAAAGAATRFHSSSSSFSPSSSSSAAAAAATIPALVPPITPPETPPDLAAAADTLARFVAAAQGRLLVLTGAGVSTASGIPDYRGPTGVYSRHEFMSSHATRQRYWARSFLGWPRMAAARPNPAHLAIRALQRAGFAEPGVVTQNVDGLHGDSNVLEIHGSLNTVECTTTSCGHKLPRSDFQTQLAALNPAGAARAAAASDGAPDVASSVNPDGDVEFAGDYSAYVYPDCPACGGVLKPSVVFFGENMPAAVRDASFARVDAATALLVVGSSLAVYSSFRLLRRAVDRGGGSDGIPVAAVTLGPTPPRGGADLRFWLDAPCHVVLPLAAAALAPAEAAAEAAAAAEWVPAAAGGMPTTTSR